MTTKIFKHGPIGVAPRIYKFTRPLFLDIQDNQLTIWAFNNDIEDLSWEVCFIGTGWELPGEFIEDHYFDSVQTHDNFVWHVFVRPLV